MTDLEIFNRQRLLGKELLGPLLFAFSASLYKHLYESRHANPVVLFAARGGLRLRYLFDLFLQATRLEAPVELKPFLVSRRAVTAAGYAIRPDLCSILIENEFRNTTVMQMAAALTDGIDGDHAHGFGEREPPDAYSRLVVSGSVRELVEGTSERSHQLREFFRSQTGLFDKYLEATCHGHRAAVLVDTGWYGSTQAILMACWPRYQWQGLYFGKWNYRHGVADHFPAMTGLFVEGTRFRSDNPRTILFRYHHLIESPLEPQQMPSVDYYRLAANGSVTTNIDQSSMAADVAGSEQEPLFLGMCDYFHEPRQSDWVGAQRDADNAIEKLCAYLLYPSAEIARLLAVGDRSADFGRTMKVPVFTRENSRWAALRFLQIMNGSLWPAGQLAIEFPRSRLLWQFALELGMRAKGL